MPSANAYIYAHAPRKRFKSFEKLNHGSDKQMQYTSSVSCLFLFENSSLYICPTNKYNWTVLFEKGD